MSRKRDDSRVRADARDAGRRALVAYLGSLDTGGAQASNVGPEPKWHEPRPDEWTLSLVGSLQQTINVELSLGEYTLQMISFFMRAPDENTVDVYRMLLRRNLDSGFVKFAVDESGDIFQRAVLPIASIDEEVLDRAIGEFYTCADAGYTPVMRLGFASAFRDSQSRH